MLKMGRRRKIWWWWWCCHFDFSSSVTFLQSSYFTPLHRSCQTKLALSRRCHTKARTDSQNLIKKQTQPTKLHRHTHNYTLIGLYSYAMAPMTWFYLSSFLIVSAVLSDFAQLISSMILTLYYRTGNGLAGTHSGADVIVLQGGVSQRLMPR